MGITRSEFAIAAVQDAGLWQVDAQTLLHRYQCNYLLLVWEEQNQKQLLFVSGSKQIRAVEFMEYLLSEFGLVKGDGERSEGVISLAILRSLMSDAEAETDEDYFWQITDRYIEETTYLIAHEYARLYEEQIRKLPLYCKKKTKWAMVKSTDIVQAGEAFIIKSLENTSGEHLVSQEDLYIMIGCRGEVYHIAAEKFHNTYELSEEQLDIFEEMLDFIPEVQLTESEEYLTIDEKARLCYPKRNVRIYAEQLAGRTKVFQGDGKGNYFLGRPGDYMAVREDDIKDIYIIQKEIFESTYEHAQNSI